jgi:hypothetical protein
MNSYRKTVFFVALAQKKGTKEMWAYARKKVTMKKKLFAEQFFCGIGLEKKILKKCGLTLVKK